MTMRKHLIIAIDGPAGSGKSTTAKLLAETIGVPYIDTGAMYRAATLKALRAGINLKDTKALIQVARKSVIRFEEGRAKKQRVFLDGKDVTKEIRLPELTKNVFYVAQQPAIRREMVKKQRALGKQNGAVMEGRDIGTVVFPNADYKFFLDADPTVRANRRHKELVEAGKAATIGQVFKELKARDASDRSRKEGPLKLAKDAVRIDTTSLTIQETVDRILTTVSPPFNSLKYGSSG